MESSVTSLEDLREEARRSTVGSREERSTADLVGTASTAASKCKVVITHPTQMTFNCPACGVSYHIYASLQRHMRDRHKDRKVMWVYVCAECEEEF